MNHRATTFQGGGDKGKDGKDSDFLTRACSRSANIVLQSTVERIYATVPDSEAAAAAAAGPEGEPSSSAPVKGYYADKTHGIFLVRGENVLLLGEIDLDRDDEPPAGFEPADFAVVERLAKEKKAADRAREKRKIKKLATLGFEGENLGEILL